MLHASCASLKTTTLSLAAALLSGTVLSTAVMALHVAPAHAEEARTQKLERVMVIGSEDALQNIAGSAQLIDEDRLEMYQYQDVNRVLREVPGINIQEEDGSGLRPNIGMRGGRVDRSSDISLMEDGVLIAPAPYSAPAAYYFPQMTRMDSIEVRKGSSTIKYGPRTTNGALNMVTREIPDEEFEAELIGSMGNFNTRNLQVNVGGTNNYGNYGEVGVLLYANHSSSDGFKDIDYVGGGSGYDIQDYMTKLRVSTPASARIYQEVELKVAANDEISDETYLGLSNADFAADPYRRYASSQLDRMDANHEQFSLQHYIEPAENVDVTTTLYKHNFYRNWYKLQSVTSGGSTVGISSVLSDTATYGGHLDVLRAFNTGSDALTVRANQRSYDSQGIQSVLGYQFDVGNTQHELQVGIRYHEDEEDRYQHEDGYGISNGVMQLTSAGAAGSNANRISSAEAWSGFVQNAVSFGDWTVTPGLRYEYIELKRENFSTSDPLRTGAGKTQFEQTVTAVIPGISTQYDVSDEISVYAGVHKGFAPPSPPSSATAASQVDEEESINYELGMRYRGDTAQAEVTGFYTDYDNLLGRDTFSSGGSGSADQFNGGEVEVMGVEAAAQVDIAPHLNVEDYALPIRVAYTWTDTEFQNSFASSFGEWGTVTAGDELPYIPEHQLYVAAGIEQDDWGAEISGKYMAEMRTTAGSGDIPPGEGTDETFIVDVAVYKELFERGGLETEAFIRVDNLFDEEYIVARRPAGARPGRPFTILAGMEFEF